MKEIEQRIIEKQDELIRYLTRFKKWVLLHTPEINASQRGKDFLSAILTRESELSALRAEQGEKKEYILNNGDTETVYSVEQSKLSSEEILNKMHSHDEYFDIVYKENVIEAMEAYHSQFEGKELPEEELRKLPTEEDIEAYAKDIFEPHNNEPQYNNPEGTQIFIEGAKAMRDGKIK